MLNRGIALLALVVLLVAGCTAVRRAERVEVEGPFEIALLATTDTRGELEPCG